MSRLCFETAYNRIAEILPVQVGVKSPVNDAVRAALIHTLQKAYADGVAEASENAVCLKAVNG